MMQTIQQTQTQKPPAPVYHGFAFYAGMLIAAATAYWLTYNFLIHMFYITGAAFLDAGNMAGTLYQNDWRLKNPIAQNYDIFTDTFYNSHITLFFIPFTYLSHIFPTSSSQYYSFFLGLGVATYTAVIYVAVFYFLADKSPRINAPIAVLTSTVAAFFLSLNGITVGVVDYGHYEIWMPALIGAFLLAFTLQKKRTALCFFILALSVREDTGLHLALPLLMIAVYRQYLGKWNVDAQKKVFLEQKEIYLWAAAAVVYTVIAFNLGGRPIHSANVSGDLFLTRLFHIFFRVDWFAVFIVTVAWAWLTHTPTLLIGFASCVPWVLFNATRDLWILGNLAIYYAFPLMIVFLFPFLADRLFPAAPPNKKKKNIRKKGLRFPRKLTSQAALLFVLLFVVASVILRPLHNGAETYGKEGAWKKVGLINFFIHNFRPVAAEPIKKAQQLKDFYLNNQTEMNIVVSDAMVSIAPKETPRARRLITREPPNILEQSSMDVLIFDTITYGSFLQHLVSAMTAFDLRHHYQMPDTPYFLTSKTPLCDENGQCVNDLPLQPLSLPQDFLLSAANKFTHGGFTFVAAALATPETPIEGDYIIAEEAGVAAEFGDVLLAPGTVAFGLDYTHDITGGIPPRLEVFIREIDGQFTQPPMQLKLPPSKKETFQYLPFTLEAHSYVRVRLIHPGGELRVSKFGFYPAPAQ